MKPTRIARLIVTAALVVGIALVMLASAEAGRGKSALELIPASSNIVWAVNAQRIRKSPYYKPLMELAKKNKEFADGLEALRSEAGFDLERDVKTIVFGMNHDGNDTKDVVVVIEGKFKLKKLLRALAKEGDKIVQRKHLGVAYWAPDKTNLWTFIGKRVIITESDELMKKVIAVSKRKALSVKKNVELMKLIRNVDASRDMWFAASLGPSAGFGSVSPGLEDLRSLNGSVDLRKGLSVRLVIGTKSEATASKMVAGLQAMMSSVAGNKEVEAMGLGPVLRKLAVSTDKARLIFSLDLNRKEVRGLTPLWNMAKGSF